VSFLNVQVDLRLIHTSQLNTDLDAVFAAVSVYRRLPRGRRELRKPGLDNLRRYVVKSAL
jgi:hypothetical protein